MRQRLAEAQAWQAKVEAAAARGEEFRWRGRPILPGEAARRVEDLEAELGQLTA